MVQGNSKVKAVISEYLMRHLDKKKMTPEVKNGVISGNVYDKYHTWNPVARFLMGRFIKSVRKLIEISGANEINEIGCGEGYLGSIFAIEGYDVRGSDISPQIVNKARESAENMGLDISYKVAGIDQLTEEDSAELVLCCEVLEHVENPRESLQKLVSLAKPYLLVSVPREPIWRVLNLVRGRYWSDFGNTPGHVQHWSRSEFMNLIREYYDPLVVMAPLPWTVALCRVKRYP